MRKTKQILSSFLVMAITLWSIGLPFSAGAFTLSSAGFSNNSPSAKKAEVLAGTANVLLLDFNLPDPNTDTIIYTGTESLTAGDALTALPATIFFSDNDDSGLYNNTTDEAIVSSANATLDNSDTVIATGTAALLAFTTQTWYVDADGGDDYDNGEAIVTSTNSTLTAGALNGGGTDAVFNNGTADIEPFATSTFNFDHSTGVNGNYDDGEAIVRNTDGAGALTASTSNIIIKAGDADFTQFNTAEATSTTPAGVGSGWQIRITGADEIWTEGEEIWIDVDTNGWTTTTDVILVGGTLSAAGTMWQLDTGASSSVWASTTVCNFGYLDSNHDAFYTYTAETGGEPIIRTGAAGQADDYDIGTNAEDEFLDPMDANATYQDINNNWVEDWTEMSTLTDLGYVNADHGTPSRNDYDEFDSNEAIIREASGAIDGNLESTDTVITSGAADLTNFDADGHRFSDANHDGLYSTTTQEAIIADVTFGTADAYDAQLSEDDTVVTSGSADLIAFTSAYTSPKFDDSGGTGTFATNGSDSILTDSDSSGTYSGDKFQSIQVNNTGATGGTVKIWVENGTSAGFQAGEDTEVGSGSFAALISTSTDPGVYTAASKDRMYITVNVPSTAAINSTIIPCIPVNGIQLVSTNDGPTNDQICGAGINVMGASYIKDFTAPSSVITAPKSNETIASETDYTILGYSTDTGGSSVKEVKISLDGGTGWTAATPLAVYDGGFTWKYVWKSPAEGSYTLKTRAEDHIGNIEIPGAGIKVKAAKETAEETTEEVKAEEIEETKEAEEETETKTEKTTEQEEAVPAAAKPLAEMTKEELRAKIVEILEAVTQLKVQLAELQKEEAGAFETNLNYGDTGDEVIKLQESLIKEGLLAVGLNTGWFGPLTKTAVVKFQEKYREDVLAPWGFTAGTGIVGQTTRAKLNELLGK